MTAPNTFGVTADSVHDQFFPQANKFNSNSSPTATAVATRISWVAADFDGALRMKGIDPTTLTVATDAAYLWCAKTLSMMVARELLNVMTGMDPAWAKVLAVDLKERIDALRERGADVLGSGGAGSTPDRGVGPLTHINRYALDMGNSSDASSVEPRLRRDDEQ